MHSVPRHEHGMRQLCSECHPWHEAILSGIMNNIRSSMHDERHACRSSVCTWCPMPGPSYTTVLITTHGHATYVVDASSRGRSLLQSAPSCTKVLGDDRRMAATVSTVPVSGSTRELYLATQLVIVSCLQQSPFFQYSPPHSYIYLQPTAVSLNRLQL